MPCLVLTRMVSALYVLRPHKKKFRHCRMSQLSEYKALQDVSSTC